MALPFFRALNPMSENSGITYALARGYQCQGREMLDSFFTDDLFNAFLQDYKLTAALGSTYALLVGCHYDLYLRGSVTSRGGSKGALDYLIFPLVARKLLANEFLPEVNVFAKVLGLVIGLPLEMTRLLLGVMLTIALSPLVCLIHAMKIWSMTPERRQALEVLSPLIPQTQFIPQQVNNAPVRLQEGSDINANKIKGLLVDVPAEYNCPLSLEIMTDPVYVISHPEHRFEKAWIMAHLSVSRTNPLTREYLSLDGIQDDVVMKGKIKDYIEGLLSNNASATLSR